MEEEEVKECAAANGSQAWGNRCFYSLSFTRSLSPSLRQPFVGCTSRSRIGRQEQQQQQQLEVIEVGKRSLVLPVLPFDIHALH